MLNNKLRGGGFIDMSARFVFRKLYEEGYWDDFLNFACYMFLRRRYSFFNSALIYLQRPGVEDIASYNEWEKLGRSVKPDATPIVILQPFGPVNFVFEYGDTEGNEIKDIGYKKCIREENPITEKLLSLLKVFLRQHAIYLGERTLGSRMKGFATMTENSRIFEYEKRNGKIERVESRTAIVVNSKLSEKEKVVTILHEIGHIFCGHLGKDVNNTRLNVVNRNGINLSMEACEYEAEKFCEMVCRLINVEYDNKEYLEDYLVNGEEPRINLMSVITAFDKFISKINIYHL